MTPTPPKKCPKCDGEMVNDKDLGSYGELTLKSKDQFLGDTVLTFYCVICGYIELYRAIKEAKTDRSYDSSIGKRTS